MVEGLLWIMSKRRSGGYLRGKGVCFVIYGKTQRPEPFRDKILVLGEATWHKTMQIIIPRHFVKEDTLTHSKMVMIASITFITQPLNYNI